MILSDEVDSNMKKRYLFPIAWVILEVMVFILPVLFPVVYIFSIPSMVIVNLIFRLSDGSTDTTYIVILGTIVQFFLIGYLWDFIAEKIAAQNTKINNE